MNLKTKLPGNPRDITNAFDDYFSYVADKLLIKIVYGKTLANNINNNIYNI
jgi:hypothetical protein